MDELTLPAEIERAPKSVKRLAHALATRGWPLKPQPLPKKAPREQRVLWAETPIGHIRVWYSHMMWGADLLPIGARDWVDEGVWEACHSGTPLPWPKPPIDEQVAWLEKMVASRPIPSVDAVCLAGFAAERNSQSIPLRGRRLAALLAIVGVSIVAIIVLSMLMDKPTFLASMVPLLMSVAVGVAMPYSHRFHQVRRERRTARRLESSNGVRELGS